MIQMGGCFNSIVIVGKIASGKTTLAKELSDRLTATVVSFGEYLRYIAKSKGLNPDRDILQTLGLEMINTQIPCRFVNDVIEYCLKNSEFKHDHLIFEGVRHVSILNAIKEISNRCIVIYIGLDDKMLIENALKRDGGDSLSITKFLNHEVESEINDLKEQADVVLFELPLEKDIQEICELFNDSKNKIGDANQGVI